MVIENYQKIRGEISRLNPNVVLIAVSKTKPFEMIRALYLAGHRDFGENYAQELSEKAKQAQSEGLSEIRWHMIGHLQSNKVKLIIPYIHLLHTLDRLSLAKELVKRGAEKKLEQECLIEIKTDSSPEKTGVELDQLESFLMEIKIKFPTLKIRGLMTIPPPVSQTSNGAQIGSIFRRVQSLGLKYFDAPILSMGMSDDYKEAISAGATHVRVGSAIFGSRVTR